jgi:hypothetical protein
VLKRIFEPSTEKAIKAQIKLQRGTTKFAVLPNMVTKEKGNDGRVM